MILRAKQFKHGFDLLLPEENSDSKMDFAVITMQKDDIELFEENKECVFTLLQGDVLFVFDGKMEKAHRESCFHEDPVVLHVPQNTNVKIIAKSDEVEILFQATHNEKAFAAKLYRSKDLLSGSEKRGAGLMNDASTRIVRTFFDRSTNPNTNFFIGEVVSYPGKWSSYPPHKHIEPEIYFYKFLPENGYAFAEMGDDAFKVKNNDLTLMPTNITHSQATAPGYAEYYLWVIRLQDDTNIVTNVVKEHAWAAEKDAKYYPDI